jgi:hypothetical protein
MKRSLHHLAGLILISSLLPESLPAATGTVAEDKERETIDLVVVDANAELYANAAGTGQASKPWLNPDNTTYQKWQTFLAGTGGNIDPTNPKGGLVELLAEEDFTIVGYVDPKFLLWGLRNGKREALRAKREDKSEGNIYRKALIVTHFKEVTATTTYDVVGPTVIVTPVRAPGGDHRQENMKANPIDIYAHRYVWKEAQVGSETWYLLANEPTRNEYRKGASKWMVGWLPQKQLHAWNTAQCVEFEYETREERLRQGGTDPSTWAARVYETESMAKLSSKPSTVASIPPSAVHSIEEIRSPGRWPALRTRFPLIKAEKLGVANQLFHLGWIGGVYVDGEQTMSAGEVDRAQNTLTTVTRGLLQLDLVIVLDGTQSMAKYRQQAIKAMDDIVSRVQAKIPTNWPAGQKSDIRTRCAIAVYRNAEDSPTGPSKRFEFMKFKNLENNSEKKEMQSYIQNIHFGSGSSVVNEDVFDGIISAVDEAELGTTSNKSAYKLMVVIGDSGNLSLKNTGTAEVIDKLNNKGYDFCAISVPERSNQRVDYVAFRSEMITIADSLKLPRGLALPASEPAYTGASRLLSLDGDDQEFITKIQKAVDLGLDSRNKVTDIVANVEIDRYPNAAQDFVKGFLKSKGVDTRILDARKVQLFGTGYSTEKNAMLESQWKTEQMVKKDDLSVYLSYLRPFDEFVRTDLEIYLDKDKIEELKDSLMLTFKLQAGDLTKKKLDTILGDASQDIPVSSDLLKKTLSELNDYLQDPAKTEERGKELRRLGVCYRILENYHSDRNFEITKDEIGQLTDAVRSADAGNANFWDRRGGTDYAWIPLEYFP